MKLIVLALMVALSWPSFAQEDVISRAANAKIALEASERAAKAATELAAARHRRLVQEQQAKEWERQAKEWKREDAEYERRRAEEKAAPALQDQKPTSGKVETPARRLGAGNFTSSDIANMSSYVADFIAGFKVGYKRAYPLCACPVAPLHPMGRITYADGFGVGYSYGLRDEGKAK